MFLTRVRNYPSVLQKNLAAIYLGCQAIFCTPSVRGLPTQINNPKIKDQSQNANYGGNDHIADNQADEKRD